MKIIFEKTYPQTLEQLVGRITSKEVDLFTFDDLPTRRKAEAAFAAKGITARCRSAYKPLVCAFREEIDTKGLTRAVITYPQHPDAGPRRFLLESYPLSAMFPQVEFIFVEGPECPEMPVYDVALSYEDGATAQLCVFAPNHSHTDYAGNIVLSPCGYLALDGVGAPFQTDYETLFHDSMAAIQSCSGGDEPYFQELNITVTLPIQDEDLGYGDEVLSLREALHEDLYFSILEHFQKFSGRIQGDRRLQPGQIVPEILYGPRVSVQISQRDYDRSSISNHVEPLDHAGRALAQPQIAAELAKIPGAGFEAISVAGRKLSAVYHPGSDRAVMISAGQHANETTAPVGCLRAAQRLAQRSGAHFTISPLENPDGYALHQRLIKNNPRHMHHAARYTALGDDLEYREGAGLYEKSIRLEAEDLSGALLHLNFHGYPAHEWTRPLSGYVPRGFEVWTIPKGFFLIMRHAVGWEKPARALMEAVTLKLDAVPGLRAFNDAQIALFERHAGETGFEILNGFPVMISHDPRHRVPMTMITEYPDETVWGDAFRAGHEAQMAAALAAYEALQDMPQELLKETAPLIS